jgi:hypothetical protein
MKSSESQRLERIPESAVVVTLDRPDARRPDWLNYFKFQRTKMSRVSTAKRPSTC